MAYRIKDIRKSKKMTQQELCEKACVSRTTLSKLENNENPEVMAGTLKAIASALEVKMSDLFLP